MVLLEHRRRDGFALRRAATIALPAHLVQPGFDERNITDTREVADTLAELVTSAGLGRQARGLRLARPTRTASEIESAPLHAPKWKKSAWNSSAAWR